MNRSILSTRAEIYYRNERGMTVMEILVASTVAVILLSALFQFFLTQTKNFDESKMTAEMQQDMRWASNYIAEKLKLAGNGIPPLSVFSVLDNYDGGVDVSDSLCVLGSYKSLVMATTQKMGNHGATVKVDSSVGIEPYDLVVISYPPSGWQEVFMCTKLASDQHIYHDAYPPWNPTNHLEHAYPLGSTVTVVSHYSFFVEEDDEGRPNLMVLTQGPYGPQVLAGDVEDFQVRFLLKNDTWVDVPTEINDIRMMEIYLRARSPNTIKGYVDADYGDSYKRVELRTIVVPKNITLVAG